MNEPSKALGAPALFDNGKGFTRAPRPLPAFFSKKPLHSKKHAIKDRQAPCPLQIGRSQRRWSQESSSGGCRAAAAPRPSCLLKGLCSSDRRPKNKPSAEPLVRRDPDRICLDDGRAFLAGDFPGNRERERRESSCQGKGRSSRVKGSRGDPFSLLFAALICLLQKHREIRACVSQRSTA